jgi:hypothetical protein
MPQSWGGGGIDLSRRVQLLCCHVRYTGSESRGLRSFRDCRVGWTVSLMVTLHHMHVHNYAHHSNTTWWVSPHVWDNSAGHKLPQHSRHGESASAFNQQHALFPNACTLSLSLL